MARKGCRVLLGFEDELITEKHKSIVNFTTNKIGGTPDWTCDDIPNPLCHLCGLALPLIVQIYAPVESSPYHRTLYLFGCINPNCWNQNESWICIRGQTLIASETGCASPSVTVNTGATTDWCQDADDWDDDNNVNNNEENGNLISCIKNVGTCNHLSDDDNEEEDENDEMTDYRSEVRMQLGNLNLDERNANCGEMKGGAGIQEGGAVGCLISPSATAEIEGDEGEVVTIDTPTAPQHDLMALLQETNPLPAVLRNSGSVNSHLSGLSCPLQFISSFISVDEENFSNSPSITPLSEHVRELLQEYQQNSGEESFNALQETGDATLQGDNLTVEKYEKSVPAHGDKMFHHFISRIQRNPGQILRYCRDGIPLLLQPLNELPIRCSSCLGDLVFEFQVLPTVIPHLQLSAAISGDSEPSTSHIEFGTVLVFTCRRSCWSAGDLFRSERVLVQAERII